MDSKLIRLRISELTKKYSTIRDKIKEELSFSDESADEENETVQYSNNLDVSKPDGENDNKETFVSQTVKKDTNVKESFITPSVPAQVSDNSLGEFEYDNFEDLESSGEHAKEVFESQHVKEVISLNESLITPKVPAKLSQSSLREFEFDNFKDLQTDDELEKTEEIQEDSVDKDSDDSSEYQPLKNIFLVADDSLEDVATASNVSVNSVLTHRSTPRSLRSIPLSPIISPIAVNKNVSQSKIQDGREFRSTDDENKGDKIRKGTDGSDVLKYRFGDKKDSSSNKTTIDRPTSHQTTNSDSDLDSVSKPVSEKGSESSVQEAVPSSLNSEYGSFDDSTKSEVLDNGRKNDDEGQTSTNSGKQSVSTSRTHASENVISIKTDNEHQNSMLSNKVEDPENVGDEELVEESDSTKLSQTFYSKPRKEELPQSSTTTSNKSVQCELICEKCPRRILRARRVTSSSSKSNINEENITESKQLRRKLSKVDIRVENSQQRPYVRTNIDLFGPDRYSSRNLDLHIDIDNTEGEDDALSPTMALDKILRKQINLTKYFMASHHQMYLACCRIVKSLNDDYKENNIIEL